MFASDVDNTSRQFAILDRAIKKRALYDMLIAVFAAPIGLACLAFVAREAIVGKEIPTGFLTLAALAIGGACLFFAVSTVRNRSFAAFVRPAESRIHQTLVTDATMVSELGAVIGARHAIRMRLRDGSLFDLPIEREEVDGMLLFLQQRCPSARPIARPSV